MRAINLVQNPAAGWRTSRERSASIAITSLVVASAAFLCARWSPLPRPSLMPFPSPSSPHPPFLLPDRGPAHSPITFLRAVGSSGRLHCSRLVNWLEVTVVRVKESTFFQVPSEKTQRRPLPQAYIHVFRVGGRIWLDFNLHISQSFSLSYTAGIQSPTETSRPHHETNLQRVFAVIPEIAQFVLQSGCGITAFSANNTMYTIMCNLTVMTRFARDEISQRLSPTRSARAAWTGQSAIRVTPDDARPQLPRQRLRQSGVLFNPCNLMYRSRKEFVRSVRIQPSFGQQAKRTPVL
ncbi:hypothetical protein EVAR_67207_1 [Eumeta japonica]|uniref:Uncharacterized protein n=1 Tax=Eumeta variegata TaxID=151549 RepID=A0A4C2A8Q1_EUMVA|nr:hypothetical protein EVAR_67207_1 [Eumeta japonica]